MSSLKPVRGTHDILPEDIQNHRYVEAALAELADRYGFDEISTPIFEFSEVFSRTLGDTSDIVTKEMYTFEDKGGEKITLRPEIPPAWRGPLFPKVWPNIFPSSCFTGAPCSATNGRKRAASGSFTKSGLNFSASKAPRRTSK